MTFLSIATRVTAVWLASSWAVMWIVGGLHANSPTIAAIGYLDTLEIMIIPALLYVVYEIAKIIMEMYG